MISIHWIKDIIIIVMIILIIITITIIKENMNLGRRRVRWSQERLGGSQGMDMIKIMVYMYEN